MLNSTYVGLDVHARSICASALVVETGEVLRSSFGYDASAVAGWCKGLPQPARCVYESGPTGFDLQRKLEAADVPCVVGAVSKMLRPSGDRVKTDRRDAAFLARTLAVGNVVEVAVPTPAQEAARDLSRAREDCREDLMRAPPALQVPAQEGDRLGRGRHVDQEAPRLAVVAALRGAQRAARLRRLPRLRHQRRGEAGPPRRGHRRAGGDARVGADGREALGAEGHRHRVRVLDRGGGRRLLALSRRAVVHVLRRPRALRVLERGVPVARQNHEDRERAREAPARRGLLAPCEGVAARAGDSAGGGGQAGAARRRVGKEGEPQAP